VLALVFRFFNVQVSSSSDSTRATDNTIGAKTTRQPMFSRSLSLERLFGDSFFLAAEAHNRKKASEKKQTGRKKKPQERKREEKKEKGYKEGF